MVTVLCEVQSSGRVTTWTQGLVSLAQRASGLEPSHGYESHTPHPFLIINVQSPNFNLSAVSDPTEMESGKVESY